MKKDILVFFSALFPPQDICSFAPYQTAAPRISIERTADETKGVSKTTTKQNPRGADTEL